MMYVVMCRFGQKALFLAVLVGAGAYLAMPVTTGLHFVATPHYFCAEHDTFEHSAADEGRLSSVGDSVGQLSFADLEAHRHILCPQVVTSWRDASEHTGTSEWESAPLPAVAGSATQTGEAYGLPTLFVAPKNPPPPSSSVFFA